MKLKKSLLLSTLALSLAACGSAGDGKPNISAKNIQKNVGKFLADTAKDVEVNGMLLTRTVKEKDGVSEASDINGEIEYKQPGTITTLVLGDKKIPLVPEGAIFAGQRLVLEDSTELRAIGTNLNYARYGKYVEKKDGVQNEHRFFLGHITPEKVMPNEGEATYKGLAFYNKLITDKEQAGDQKAEANIAAQSSFKVDFLAKKITGEISSNSNQFETLTFKADIIGNRFRTESENALSDNKPQLNAMHGAFYGPDAEEVAGVYRSLQPGAEVDGTFGAKREK
ncbi:transferrin-binding protein-like solute binding protein [Neisseria sp. Dent CA1/247]|uniref:transferrin-binding protein-like solute binding protein n=1 Tax=Neisseria sp. Dent CA1/247 TaxID=2912675 RepID=UPI001FD5A1BE|nr:transferrin-binding protein-like solute binding protein [Neisseria sp. Dent CA1/247]UOO77032.1 transferrin-binding protein-like solute binding protein [Neisseria sp. Dent CA1/247]